VFAWGHNENGQLGNGTTNDSNIPLEVEKLRGINITLVVCGIYHNMALTGNSFIFLLLFCSDFFFVLFDSDNGKVFVWGWNGDGQLGTNNTQNEMIPVELNALNQHHITNIACGYDHSLALTGQFQVFSCLKWNDFIVCSLVLSCLITEKGELFAWGDNEYGQLGIDGKEQQLSPVLVKSEHI
jgi:RCC1 and BTB domain-containing protein